MIACLPSKCKAEFKPQCPKKRQKFYTYQMWGTSQTLSFLGARAKREMGSILQFPVTTR
jgi:hypothetical protein